MRFVILGAVRPPVEKVVWEAAFETLCHRMEAVVRRPKVFKLGEADVVPIGGEPSWLGFVQWGIRVAPPVISSMASS